MRVRPFFWCVLMASCICVLLLAICVHLNVPAELQITLDHSTQVTTQATTLTLRLTDMQGLPIDDARAVSDINMTNMNMGDELLHLQSLGQGRYATHLQWSMAGSWRVTVQVHANGFTPIQRTVFVHVV